MGMTNLTVATGKEITVTDGQGSQRTYTATQTVDVPDADAARFIAAGLATETE
jgi:hypothetical protein